MTDENRSEQLIVFGATFTTIGVAIGVADSYGVLSFLFLGLGVLLSFVGAVLAIREDDALD